MSSVPDSSSILPFRQRVAQRIGLAIFITSVCLLVFLRIGFRQVMLEELDATLQHDAQSLIAKYKKQPVDLKVLASEFENYLPESETIAPFASLLDANGNVLFTTAGTPSPIPHVSHTAAGSAITYGRFRVLEVPVEAGARAPHAVMVGASLQSFQQYLLAYDRYMMFAGISVAVISLVCIFWFSADAVAPISQFVRTAETLNNDARKLRLPRTGSLDELDRLAKVMNQLLERITLDEYENRHLLADAAHQLRTPLAAIRSSVEVALAGKQGAEAYQELLAQVVDETESLEALVNQLLLLSETEMPPTTQIREKVAFDQLVQRSVEMFEPVADSRGVSVWIGTLARAEILGNRHHLRQVINNLLENAVKFTAVKSEAERRQVTVEITTDPQLHQAQLRVSDTGIGISAEHMNRVFDRFYRADSARTREQGASGNGLGLSIVKAVTESHGGTVQVESTIGVGTTMIVTLPLMVSKVMEESNAA